MRKECKEIVLNARVDSTEVIAATERVDELRFKIKEVYKLVKDLGPLLRNLKLKVYIDDWDRDLTRKGN